MIGSWNRITLTLATLSLLAVGPGLGQTAGEARVEWTDLSDSQLVIFAGMTHVPLFAHPEANRILREFLSGPKRKVDP